MAPPVSLDPLHQLGRAPVQTLKKENQTPKVSGLTLAKKGEGQLSGRENDQEGPRRDARHEGIWNWRE